MICPVCNGTRIIRRKGWGVDACPVCGKLAESEYDDYRRYERAKALAERIEKGRDKRKSSLEMLDADVTCAIRSLAVSRSLPRPSGPILTRRSGHRPAAAGTDPQRCWGPQFDAYNPHPKLGSLAILS